MGESRMLSLNHVGSDFSIEELEPRMEMQMLGLGANPAIDICIITSGGGVCLTYIRRSLTITIAPSYIRIHYSYLR